MAHLIVHRGLRLARPAVGGHRLAQHRLADLLVDVAPEGFEHPLRPGQRQAPFKGNLHRLRQHRRRVGADVRHRLVELGHIVFGGLRPVAPDAQRQAVGLDKRHPVLGRIGLAHPAESDHAGQPAPKGQTGFHPCPVADELERLQRHAIDRPGLVQQTQLATRLPVKHEKARVTMIEARGGPAAGAARPVDLDHGEPLAQGIQQILDHVGKAGMLGYFLAHRLGDLHVARAVAGRFDLRHDAGDRALARAQNREIVRVPLLHLLGQDQELAQLALVAGAQDRRQLDRGQTGRGTARPGLADAGHPACRQRLGQLLLPHRAAIGIKQRHQNSPFCAANPPVSRKSRSKSSPPWRGTGV